MRILSPVTRNGHSSAHADCIKRGSGWHPFRDLLASSSDHISSSPPFESPTNSKKSPFFGTLLYFSSTAPFFVYFRALINACLVWCQPSCMNFGATFHPVLEFFGPYLASADNIPNHRLVLYSIFSFFLPLQPLLWLSHASVLVLFTAALSTLLFTAASVHLTVWATMRKTWEGSSRGMPPSTMFPFPLFYTLYFYLELNSPIH